LFDLVEEPLDRIADAIKVAAKADWLRPVSLWRDVCPRAVLADKCPDPIRIKSSIREQHGSRFQAGQQGEDKMVVVRLASGQRETDRQPTGIDDRMHLGRQFAALGGIADIGWLWPQMDLARLTHQRLGPNWLRFLIEPY
jgi:hypothetical protein